MLTWAFLLVLAAAVQSQSAHSSKSIETLFASTRSNEPSPSRRSQAGSSPPEIPLLNHHITTVKFRSTDDDATNHKFNALAPAPEFEAVRAPLAKSVQSPQGLSLDSARLLRNWEAENIVLLATIDGAIHARDRKTGDPRWSLGIPDSPMIQTIHHCYNKTDDGENDCDHDYVFIVEPSKDGNLFVQHKNPQIGLQRLGVTVKSLAAEAPGFVEDPPLMTVSYTEHTAYVVDAASGNILSQLSKHSAFVNDNHERSCRRLSGFELDDPSCDPIGAINLGRVEYTIRIANKVTLELLCTIKFAEWIPNALDKSLQEQYVSPLDTSHIQTYYNGRIQGLESDPEDGKFHRYTRVMDTPVARVFDVVRPLDRGNELGELKLLSRPLDAPLLSPAQYWRDDLQRTERVFVNKTESGIWFALSELSYPGVTAGAKPANSHWNSDSMPIDFDNNMDDIIGVHVLSAERSRVPMQLTIEGRPQNSNVLVEAEKSLSTDDILAAAPDLLSQIGNSWSLLANLVLVSIVVLIFGINRRIPAALRLNEWLRKKGVEISLHDPNADSSDKDVPAPKDDVPVVDADGTRPTGTVTEIVNDAVEEALATPARSRTQSSAAAVLSPNKEDKSSENAEQDSEADSDVEKDPGAGDEAQENGSGSKRKAKRGKRGGRKNKSKKQMDPEAMDATTDHAKEDHPEPGLTTVGRLRINTKETDCLGRGSNGTVVFPGTYDGRTVAVKRLLRHSSALAAKEIKHLLSSDENPHVVRYFGKEESPAFIYIALDLFRTSLDRFVEKPEDFPDLITPLEGFDVKDCLTQITEGVGHLHSLKLVHRDIKPQNVLVKSVKTNRPVSRPKLSFVISDFGLCKPLEEGPESAFAPTANHTAAGTTGWRAPELLVNYSDAVAAPNAEPLTSKSVTHSTTHSATHSVDGTVIEPTSGRRATKAIDIFSLGCVFYYVMTQGKHPFDVGGTSLGRDLNIKEGRTYTDHLRLNNDWFDAEDLILQMLSHNPKNRPATMTVLKHPYFWEAEEKLEFICDVSDCYEKEKNSIKDIHNPNAVRTEAELESFAELDALQEKGPGVIVKGDFLRELPRSFIQEMGKQRKYTGSKMIDLLRVIRNKKNHFHDLPDDVKEMMLGGSTKGYWTFWEKRFPSLLINCHCLLIERGIIETFRMDRYYT